MFAFDCRENEKSLRCRSENPILAGSVIENVITLQVSCEYPKKKMRMMMRLGNKDEDNKPHILYGYIAI